ncbi:ABC transporter transmembrane domain-containing protein [Streptococcus ictaluri]|uniref:ABC transporter transmembrane region n=1 Tax=Streptococcus ictaluri 707-05 TaxID=764299 RepID=G5K1Q4_9STRE|nr:ABC transporter ATP-binding protein [Streptococcus ictaluri]EHI70039.1 ABC transporter transmembrane region [Streptococcus ictaluri 707-05]
MIRFLQTYFSLSETGAKNVLKAAGMSFLKYLSFMTPILLVFQFLNDVILNQLKPLYSYLLIWLLLVVVIFVITQKEYSLTYDTTYQESAAMRIRIANKLKELPLSYFSKHSVSDISQTVMLDVSNIESTISHALPQAIGFLFFLGLISVMLMSAKPLLGLVVVMPIWLTIIMMFLSRNAQTYFVSRYYQKLLDNASSFQEAFEMQEEIKSYSMQRQVEERVLKDLSDTETLHIKAEFFMVSFSAIIAILPFLSPVLGATVGANLFHAKSLDLLTYLGFLMAATNISAQFTQLNEMLMMIFFFKDSYKRLRDLYAQSLQEGQDNPNITDYEISFEAVTFAYDQRPVLNQLSFQAKSGEITAIVGPSGCGKTTILRLLSRLYDYQKGHIRLGGRDIKGMSTDSLCLSRY